jgi:hypothetical protein
MCGSLLGWMRTRTFSLQTAEALPLTASPEVRASLHENGLALLHIGSGQVFLANQVGARTWQGISAGKSIAAISSELSHEYGLCPDQVRNDAEEFVAQLEQRGLVKREKPMPAPRHRGLLLLEALWELVLYDLTMAVFGFRRVYIQLEREQRWSHAQPFARDLEAQVAKAVSTASSFYWKPVKCLQQSIAAARLLRKYGVPAPLHSSAMRGSRWLAVW